MHCLLPGWDAVVCRAAVKRDAEAIFDFCAATMRRLLPV
jgi:hypothetical protein